ncbi:MAG: class I SAM-dependent methyltransferase [Tenericutes bacterium]|nr:class I SAM-dependent methyltransferase [Mycoplasmatota bacterium]
MGDSQEQNNFDTNLEVKLANRSAWNTLGSGWRNDLGQKVPVDVRRMIETRKRFYQKVYGMIDSFFGSLKGRVVLDLGCGFSDYQFWLIRDSGCLVSVDLSVEMVKLCREHLENKNLFVVADAEHLPFREGVFDVALTFQALHHFPCWKSSLREMKRVSDGLAFYEPNGKSVPHVIMHLIRKTFHTENRAKTVKDDYALVEFHAEGFSGGEVANFLKSEGFNVCLRTVGIIPVSVMQNLSKIFPFASCLVDCVENLFMKIPFVRGQLGNLVVSARKF